MSSLIPHVPLRLHSMRTRLMLWNGITLALILTLLGIIIHYSVQAGLMTSVDKDLRRKTEEHLHGPPRDEGPPPMRREEARWSETNGLPFHPLVLDRQGIALPPFDPNPPWDPEAFARSLQGEEVYSNREIDGEPVRIFSRPVWREDRIVGVVQDVRPLSEINQALNGVNRTLLALIPVALLLAGIGGALLTDRALRPMRQITRTAEQIGGQDLSRRLPVSGEDEFAELARTFNGMLSRLELTFGQQMQLVERLQRAIEQQKRFTGDASHELKTPLTIIKANSSLALRGESSAAEYRETLEEINQAADTMTHLVQDLLLLARADEGHLGKSRETLSVPMVLEEAIARVRRTESAPVLFAPPSSPLIMTGNREELIRLFCNLLENAERWTPQDGKIQVEAAEIGAQAQITITDTGAGIASEHLPHLCERFYRVDTARSRPDGGTGLGLSICQSIVEAHGGRITIQSQIGAGTSVGIILPLFLNMQRESVQRI